MRIVRLQTCDGKAAVTQRLNVPCMLLEGAIDIGLSFDTARQTGSEASAGWTDDGAGEVQEAPF
jgi:hypothetical protein